MPDPEEERRRRKIHRLVTGRATPEMEQAALQAAMRKNIERGLVSPDEAVAFTGPGPERLSLGGSLKRLGLGFLGAGNVVSAPFDLFFQTVAEVSPVELEPFARFLTRSGLQTAVEAAFRRSNEPSRAPLEDITRFGRLKRPSLPAGPVEAIEAFRERPTREQIGLSLLDPFLAFGAAKGALAGARAARPAAGRAATVVRPRVALAGAEEAGEASRPFKMVRSRETGKLEKVLLTEAEQRTETLRAEWNASPKGKRRTELEELYPGRTPTQEAELTTLRQEFRELGMTPAERTAWRKELKAAEAEDLRAERQVEREEAREAVEEEAETMAPRTAVQGGLGIREAPQQVGMELGRRGAKAPLIPPETVAAQAERARLLREGQEVLPEAAQTGLPARSSVISSETGVPFTGRLFRGYGRPTRESVFDPHFAQENIFGEATYVTPKREFAETFGPEVSEVVVSLRNPLVIDTDRQWLALTREAGWLSFAPSDAADVQRMRKLIVDKGHDGVIIRVPESEQVGKRLQDAFGDDTVVDFTQVLAKPPEAAPARAPMAVRPELDDLPRSAFAERVQEVDQQLFERLHGIEWAAGTGRLSAKVEIQLRKATNTEWLRLAEQMPEGTMMNDVPGWLNSRLEAPSEAGQAARVAEEAPQTALAPRTAVQGGLGVGEAPQQVGMEIGGRGAKAPLIEPETVAAPGAVPPRAAVAVPPARVGPPARPEAPIPPSRDIPGGNLIGDMQPFDEIVSVASRPDVWRRISNLPGVRTVVGTLNPAAVAQKPAELAVMGRAMSQHQAEQLTIGAMAHLNALGPQEKLFGKLDAAGLLATGPLKGLHLNDIRTYPGRYAGKLTGDQKRWIETADQLERSKLAALKNEGIDIAELTFEEGGQYAGRRVMAKVLKDGEVVETAFIGPGPGRRIGAKLGAEKVRVFKTAAEATRKGFRYLPEDEALALNIQGALNRIADNRMADWLLQRVDWRSVAGPEGPKVAREMAQRNVASARHAILAIQRAIRGESLPTGTVKAIERLFPQFKDRLRKPTRIHVQDVLDAAVKLQEPERELAVPKPGALIKVGKLIDEAAAQLRQNPRNPELIRKLSRLRSELGFLKYRIGLGEPLTLPHRPVKELRAASIKELQEVLDAIRGTRPPGATEARFRGGLIEELQRTLQEAEAAAARSAKLARSPRYGEATVQAPAFAGKVFTGPEAQETARILRASMDPLFIEALTAVNKVNAVARYFKLAGDASPMMIQLLYLAGANPRVYAKAGGGFVRAVFDPEFLARYLAKPENQAIIRKYPDLILPTGGRNEFTEAMQRGGLLRSGPFKIAGIVLEPGQRGFEGSLTVAGVEMAKAYDHLGTSAERIADVSQFINQFRGLTSSKRLGVSPIVREGEVAIVLAPRYNRAIAGLLFDTARGNLRGSLARQSLARGIAAISAMSVAVSYARGENFDEIVEHFDPNSPKFYTWEVGGQNVGPGSKIRSVVRLFAASLNDPESLANIGQYTFMRSPAWRFLRSNLSLGAGTGLDFLIGTDYIGDETRDGLLSFTRTLGKNFIPVWVESFALDGGSLLERAIRGGVEFFGGRAYPVNITSKLYHEWRPELEEYRKMPTTEVERLRQGVKTTRLQFRENHAELDAKLFIVGDVKSLQSLRAVTEAARLIRENEVNPDDIPGIKDRKADLEEAREAGLIKEKTNVDVLIDKLQASEEEKWSNRSEEFKEIQKRRQRIHELVVGTP